MVGAIRSSRLVVAMLLLRASATAFHSSPRILATVMGRGNLASRSPLPSGRWGSYLTWKYGLGQQRSPFATRFFASAGASQHAKEDGSDSERPACFVRCAPDEPNLTVELDISGKKRILSRMQDDPLNSTIDRLVKLFSEKGKYGKGKKKKVKGKGKRRQALSAEDATSTSEKQEEVALPKVWLEDTKGTEVPTDMSNKDAWQHGYRLRVDDRTFDVLANIPTVSVQLRQPAIEGFALQPTFSVEFGSRSAVRWRWYAMDANEEEDELGSEDVDLEELDLLREGDAWYIPTKEDVGRQILVEVSPFRNEPDGAIVWGRSEVVECSAEVEAMPDLSVHHPRFEHVRQVQESGRRDSLLRLVSYNILADNYANTPFARDKLYHYCPAEFLNVDFRKQLVVWEILQYEADVVCLQEVERSLFESYLAPQLERGGLEGVFMNKISGGSIGCATFFRQSTLDLAAHSCVDLTQGWSNYADLKALCEGGSPVAEKMTRALTRSTTIGQVCVFRRREAGAAAPGTAPTLVVANTHLFGHPDAAHVRVLQGATLLRSLHHTLRRSPSPSAAPPAVLLCGDLNSCPEEALRQLLLAGKVSADHPDWWRSAKYEPIDSRAEREAAWFDREEEGPEEVAAETGRSPVSADVEVPLRMVQACPSVATSFCTDGNAQVRTLRLGVRLTPTWRIWLWLTSAEVQLVDYIYYSPEALMVDTESGDFPAFSDEEIMANTGLPSRRFPSDHVALVQDFCWPAARQSEPLPPSDAPGSG